MNERIAELYRQAHLGTKDADGKNPQYFSATKFAELIVWDCFLIGAKYIKSNDDVSKFERHLKETFRS